MKSDSSRIRALRVPCVCAGSRSSVVLTWSYTLKNLSAFGNNCLKIKKRVFSRTIFSWGYLGCVQFNSWKVFLLLKNRKPIKWVQLEAIFSEADFRYYNFRSTVDNFFLSFSFFQMDENRKMFYSRFKVDKETGRFHICFKLQLFHST